MFNFGSVFLFLAAGEGGGSVWCLQRSFIGNYVYIYISIYIYSTYYTYYTNAFWCTNLYIHSTLQKKNCCFCRVFNHCAKLWAVPNLLQLFLYWWLQYKLVCSYKYIYICQYLYIDTFVIQYANVHKKHVKVYVLANSPRIFSNEQWFKNNRYSTVSISVYSTFTSFKHHWFHPSCVPVSTVENVVVLSENPPTVAPRLLSPLMWLVGGYVFFVEGAGSCSNFFPLIALPKTKIAPENGWLEYDRFLLGPGLFSGVNSLLVSRVFLGMSLRVPTRNPQESFINSWHPHCTSWG